MAASGKLNKYTILKDIHKNGCLFYTNAKEYFTDSLKG